jgi:hypothetical protein
MPRCAASEPAATGGKRQRLHSAVRRRDRQPGLHGQRRGLLPRNTDGSCSFGQASLHKEDMIAAAGTLSF